MQPSPKRFPMPADLTERWLLRVDKNGPDGCWIWLGAKWSLGYGKFTLPGSQRRIGAHRWGYERFVGPVPDDLVMDHLCRRPSCVNPDHLEPVPFAENVRRGIAGEVNKQRCRAISACPKGHPYDEANTYHRPDGGRNCRACGRIVAARLREARRAVRP